MAQDGVGKDDLMDKRTYCTQNDGDCLSCSLSNYGRDCRNLLLMEDEILTQTEGAENENGRIKVQKTDKSY